MSSNKKINKRTVKPSVPSSGRADSTEKPDPDQPREQLESFFQIAATDVKDVAKNRRKRPEERGLPSDSTLLAFASTYLETQRRLWPERVKLGQLPPLNDETIARMAADFKRRFLAIDSDLDLPILGEDCAASYNRFSDEGSNHRSLSQQLRLQLERAAQHRHFIPWEFVFADAAVTGTTAKRRGYEMVKSALRTDHLAIKTLYIDEIGRASRDAIEALTLGKMLEALTKRIIGISDGFDSNSSSSKMMLMNFAMMQEWFIDQLKSKVNRGMDDAFERDANTGLPAVGYHLVPLFDPVGRPVIGREGIQVNTLAIDAVRAKVILRVFILYAVKGWSPERIAQLLNRVKFDGRANWDGGRVRTLLRNRLYIGIKIYRKTRQECDPATGKVTVIRRPRSEWRVKRARHLQVIPFKIWKLTKRKLQMGTDAWSKNRSPLQNRAEVYPKTLFRPICGCCKAPLALGRSGKHAALVCMNGRDRKHGCVNRGYKSLQIVEKGILAVIRDQILTDERMSRLVEATLLHVKQLHDQPKINTTPITEQMKKEKKSLHNLYRLASKDDFQELEGARALAQKHERRIKQLQKELEEARHQNSTPPAPPTIGEIVGYLADLRGLLNQDVGAAAPLLSELTGPIMITQVKEEGKRGYTWIAEFTVNLVQFLARLEARKDCPTTGIWEYLNTRGWIFQIAHESRIEKLPNYEKHAQEISEMYARKTPKLVIAAHLNISLQYVDYALNFAQTGQRPKWKTKSKPESKTLSSDEGTPAKPNYKDIAEDVARLRDEEKLSWRAISEWIDQEKNFRFEEAAIRRAYDFGHPERVLDAVAKGQNTNRGPYSILGESVFRKIRSLLKSGMPPKSVAERVGCGESTVRRELKKLNSPS